MVPCRLELEIFVNCSALKVVHCLDEIIFTKTLVITLAPPLCNHDCPFFRVHNMKTIHLIRFICSHKMWSINGLALLKDNSKHKSKIVFCDF